jgi:hypothetical protein
MESLNEYDAEKFIQVILAYRFQEYVKKATQESRVVMPNSPGSDATLEQIEEYEATVDEFDKKRNQEIMGIVDALREADTAKLRLLDADSLLRETAKAMENNICQSVANDALMDKFAYMATYEDGGYTKRYFTNFSEYGDLAGATKKQLIDGYQKLMLGPEDLKN